MDWIKKKDTNAAAYYQDEINTTQVKLPIRVIVHLYETPYAATPH